MSKIIIFNKYRETVALSNYLLDRAFHQHKDAVKKTNLLHIQNNRKGHFEYRIWFQTSVR